MNTIVADSLAYIADELEKVTKGDEKKLNTAIQKLIKKIMAEHGSIIFNGDNYTADWHKEAEKRGLPNLKTTVDALPVLTSREVVSLFGRHKVLSKRELESRQEVYLEQYCMSVGVEANLVVKMAKTIIYPAASRYQGELATTVASLKALGNPFETTMLDEVTQAMQGLQASIATLEKVMDHEAKTMLAEAKHACDKILPAMLEVRRYADELEGLVADDLWPLPTYQEILFIK
jgi:glutamine synthetase